ncbi:hypothetical protein M413DRAFT_227859 [Hebeloma cylindrosporum]|uniref:Uncharacterized protein n=1 Tax=Hebeloma cylindrosporum TaxID=76867 RepID=A0A0C3CHT9_HEBCY|nr:hypothetical protein M413DRAFT_227859 [Hebeloma cylindrosporum h7]
MPRAIISPSVLASDFGQLTAECKRMIVSGAEWLHMGKFPDSFPLKYLIFSSRCYGWPLCAQHYNGYVLRAPRSPSSPAYSFSLSRRTNSLMRA